MNNDNDIVTQLVGNFKSWEEVNILTVSLNKPSKFPTAASAIVNFAEGIVSTYDEESNLLQQFIIEAKLIEKPIEKPL